MSGFSTVQVRHLTVPRSIVHCYGSHSKGPIAPVQHKCLSRVPWTPVRVSRPVSHRDRRSQRNKTTSLRVYNISSAGASSEPLSDSSDASISDLARQSLIKAALSLRRFGWFGFWSQLILSVVSTVILLFSAAFTSQNNPTVSVYLTLFGVVALFLSTFWSFGYTRMSMRLIEYTNAPSAPGVKKIKRSDVSSALERSIILNTIGMGATLIGLEATVGTLVAKTLTNATANPFISGGQGSWNPVLALDVFSVQASTNALLGHFISCACALWVLKVVSDKRAQRQIAQ